MLWKLSRSIVATSTDDWPTCITEGGVAAPARLLHTVAPAARAPAAALGAGVGRHLPTPGSKAAVERTNFKGRKYRNYFIQNAQKKVSWVKIPPGFITHFLTELIHTQSPRQLALSWLAIPLHLTHCAQVIALRWPPQFTSEYKPHVINLFPK